MNSSAVYEDKFGDLCTEASSLGLAPGEWPTELIIPRIGVFDFVDVDQDETEFTYRLRGSGQLLKIWND